MTIHEVQKHQFYIQLSPQQRAYVTARCEGSDPIDAVKKAYNTTSDASAATIANKLKRNPNVSWLVAEFFGESPDNRVPTREELASWAWKKAKAANADDLALNYAKLVVDIQGYKVKPAENPQEPNSGESSVWDEVKAIEQNDSTGTS